MAGGRATPEAACCQWTTEGQALARCGDVTAGTFVKEPVLGRVPRGITGRLNRWSEPCWPNVERHTF